jgi:hypothetical protein
MVEITLPIVLQIIQTVGILVGIIYYLIIMRNSQRNQKLQLETRQAQLFMQWYQKFDNATEGIQTMDVLKNAKFETHEAWIMLMETDELFRKTWMAYGSFFEGIGVIVKEGLGTYNRRPQRIL